MVRRKLDMKKIEDKSRRQVTFTKRRKGLFKKAGELCIKCDAQIAIITFSMAGNIFAWGHPSVDSILKRYKACKAQNPDDHNQTKLTPETESRPPPADDNDHESRRDMGLALSLSPPADEEEDTTKRSEKKNADHIHEKGLVLKDNDQEGEKRLEGHAAAAKSRQMMTASWNLPKVHGLQMDELQRLIVDMEEMKKKVVDRINQMRSSAQAPTSKSA